MINFSLSFPRFRQIRAALAVVFLAALLAACVEDDFGKGYVELPVDEIYNNALDHLKQGEFRGAAGLFDEVERQHPYSSWATRAQLMAAYSYYLNEDYDESVIAIERFIQLHPSNKNVPYAYYLKGLSYYEQISDVARDQKMTELALKAFKDLSTRFPESKYARDAKVKLDLTFDHLAGKEMEIGRYYLRQKQYLAAINRFRSVVSEFQSTTHVPEALHRLGESYTALGLAGEAQKVAAVLGHNFPGSEWYIDSYEMVADKEIRVREKASWYQVWKRDEGPRVQPLITKIDDPWYKFWGGRGPKDQTLTTDAATTKTSKVFTLKREEPWYRFWGGRAGPPEPVPGGVAAKKQPEPEPEKKKPWYKFW